jgi:transposase
VGLDKIALKRGHRDYVTWVTAPLESGGVDVLAVLADRKQETVAQFLGSIPDRLKRTIKRVCSDMYQGFISAAREQLPEAEIVIDRFHVAKIYRDCADTVRKREVKRLKQELSKAEYKAIKGAMWPFRKSPVNLQDEEWELLKRLFSYSPKLAQAYILREELFDIRSLSKTSIKISRLTLMSFLARLRLVD